MAHSFVFLHYKSSNLVYFLTALELQRQSYFSDPCSFSVPEAVVIFCSSLTALLIAFFLWLMGN